MSDELDKALDEVSKDGTVIYSFQRRLNLKRLSRILSTMEIGDVLVIPRGEDDGWRDEIRRYRESQEKQGNYVLFIIEYIDNIAHVRRVK